MTSATRARQYISINEDMATGIQIVNELYDNEKIVRVYSLSGQLLLVEENKSIDDIQKLLKAGVYVINGKKVIIK